MDEVKVHLEGVNETLEFLARMVDQQPQQMRKAVENILRLMRDYAKDFAPFKDRTGNLRNSIQYEMDEGGTPAGTLYAGMNYAIYVELRDGYWVLQGAIDYFEPLVNELFKGAIQVDSQMLKAKYAPRPEEGI